MPGLFYNFIKGDDGEEVALFVLQKRAAGWWKAVETARQIHPMSRALKLSVGAAGCARHSVTV